MLLFVDCQGEPSLKMPFSEFLESLKKRHCRLDRQVGSPDVQKSFTSYLRQSVWYRPCVCLDHALRPNPTTNHLQTDHLLLPYSMYWVVRCGGSRNKVIVLVVFSPRVDGSLQSLIPLLFASHGRRTYGHYSITSFPGFHALCMLSFRLTT